MSSIYSQSRKRIAFIYLIAVLIIVILVYIGTYVVNSYYETKLLENENGEFIELFTFYVTSSSEEEAADFAELYSRVNRVAMNITDSEDNAYFVSNLPVIEQTTYNVPFNEKILIITLDNSRNNVITINDDETVLINVILISSFTLSLLIFLVTRRRRNTRLVGDLNNIQTLIDQNPHKDLLFNFVELKTLYEELENRISTIDLLNERRDDILNGLIHDLKTPITILINHLEDATDTTYILDNKEAINQSLDDLNSIVNDIISDKFMMSKKDINLSKILDREINKYKSAFKSKDLTIKSTILEDITVSWNKRDVARVLRNLLTNAYHYSDNGTTVYINLIHGKKTYDLNITNTGNPINKDDLTKIFDKNYRATTNNKEGNGLGLYITKLLVEEVDGKIKATSENKENTFTISIPKEDA